MSRARFVTAGRLQAGSYPSWVVRPVIFVRFYRDLVDACVFGRFSRRDLVGEGVWGNSDFLNLASGPE